MISCSTRWQMALDCNPPRTKCRARYSSGDSPFEMERPYRHYPTIERDKYKWMFKSSFVLYLVGWRGREREREKDKEAVRPHCSIQLGFRPSDA